MDFLRKFIGADPGAEFSVKPGGKLARVFETYCLEGRSPGVELEGTFAALRHLKWMRCRGFLFFNTLTFTLHNQTES